MARKDDSDDFEQGYNKKQERQEQHVYCQCGSAHFLLNNIKEV